MKTIETNQKTIKDHENTLQTMETKQNHEKKGKLPRTKIPSDMEEAPCYKLFTVITLLTLLTAYTGMGWKWWIIPL